MALYNQMGSTVLTELARQQSDWSAVELVSEGKLSYKLSEENEELKKAPKFMLDEGATKSDKETQQEIDTKIKYSLTVLSELEKSIREVFQKRKIDGNDEKWQEIFHKYVIENVKDFIFFNKKHLAGIASSLLDEEMSESDEE